MSYVDAGYTIALVVLSLYALTLVLRRRRLGRAANLRNPAAPAPGRAVDGGSRPTGGE